MTTVDSLSKLFVAPPREVELNAFMALENSPKEKGRDLDDATTEDVTGSASSSELSDLDDEDEKKIEEDMEESAQ